MNSPPRSEKFKKILNDELDNLELWEAFGKPVTITKADRVSNLDRCLMWDKEEPHSLRYTEISVKEHGRIVTFDDFLKLVDDCQLLDFSNLNNESIVHPDIPDYQPSDGELYVIRKLNTISKLKRLRSLLEVDLENIEFWDVEGVLVTEAKSFTKSNLPFWSIAWTSEGGRMFPLDSVHRNGAPITYEIFLQSFKDELNRSIGSSWSKD
jgi:hypothetical protein